MIHSAERADLAAAFRWAARLGLHEGIDNHFSHALADGSILINPFGAHWSRIKGSDLLRVTSNGALIGKGGEYDPTSFFIHRAIHQARPEMLCALHTHMPYATALTCMEGGRLLPVHQNAIRFLPDVAYDDDFNGLALDEDEGTRIARQLGDKRVLFLANHGIIVVGETVAVAFDALYFVERACHLQWLASALGPLRLVPEDIVARTAAQKAQTSRRIAPAHFAALRAILDEEEPEYRT